MRLAPPGRRCCGAVEPRSRSINRVKHRRTLDPRQPDLFARRQRHRFETTYDIKVPLSVDDLAMDYGWRMIPIAPTGDPGWFIFDNSHDKRTVWAIPVNDDRGEA